MTVCLSPNGSLQHHLAAPPTRVLVGTTDGVVTLERSAPGDTWRITDRALQGQHVSSVLLEPERGGLFVGVHRGGIFASHDDGHTWQPSDDGLSVPHVYCLGSVDWGGAARLYAGTQPAHLFVSEDYGRSWRELPALRAVPETERWEFPEPPHEAHVKCLAFHPDRPGTLYAGVEQGALLVSTDDGETWREITSYTRPEDDIYKDIHRLRLRPSNPDELFLSTGLGLYHSRDAGETWEHLTDRSFRVGYPDHFVFAPDDDRVLFLSGASHDPGQWFQSHTAEATILRSEDGGRTWEPADAGLPQPLRGNIEALSLAAYPGGYALFAATTDGEVFTSEDRGEWWTLAAGGLPPISKAGHFRVLAMA